MDSVCRIPVRMALKKVRLTGSLSRKFHFFYVLYLLRIVYFILSFFREGKIFNKMSHLFIFDKWQYFYQISMNFHEIRFKWILNISWNYRVQYKSLFKGLDFGMWYFYDIELKILIFQKKESFQYFSFCFSGWDVFMVLISFSIERFYKLSEHIWFIEAKGLVFYRTWRFSIFISITRTCIGV